MEQPNVAIVGGIRRTLKLKGAKPPAVRKGAVLTMDALFALGLLLLSMLTILMLLTRHAPYQAPALSSASDMMNVLRTMELQDLDGNPRYPYANQVIDDRRTSPYNATVIETIIDLYMGNNTTAAAQNLSAEIIGWAVPNDYGVELLVEKSGTDCQGLNSSYSCVYNETRGASRHFVSTGRHFIYSNNVTREVRLVLYK